MPSTHLGTTRNPMREARRQHIHGRVQSMTKPTLLYQWRAVWIASGATVRLLLAGTLILAAGLFVIVAFVLLVGVFLS